MSEERRTLKTFAVSREEAERIVRDAMRFFGITKEARVHLVASAELRARMGIDHDVQALCRFEPDQSDCDIFLTELSLDPVHSLYHEVSHLAFVDLHAAIENLQRVEERLVDYFALIASRKRTKPRVRRSKKGGQKDEQGTDTTAADD